MIDIGAEALNLQATQAKEKLYWQMISNGWLPSHGWKIRGRIVTEGTAIRYECWAVCPSVTVDNVKKGTGK